MKIVCAWCLKDLGHKDSGSPEDVTHGICPECHDRLLCETGRKTLGDLLNSLEFPVFVMDDEVRVVDGNERALKIVAKEAEDVRGLLSGDVMECEYAKLPGGCGKTLHCGGCSIRMSVVHTHQTGEPLFDVPCHVGKFDEGGEKVEFVRLTTFRVGESVLLKIT